MNEQFEALAVSIHVIEPDASETFITDVLRRLASLGYEASDKDMFTVSFGISKTLEKVKSECGCIPDGLQSRLVDACCGEILRSMYGTGQLDISTLDLTGAVSSIKEGDATISFDNATSDAAKFTMLTAQLTIKEGDMSCYRVIKWN